MEFELRYCIGHHGSKLLCSRLGRSSYSWESILSHESSSRFEASCTLGINVASLAFLLNQEYRSIVLFRQASNPHQNIVWITSSIRTIVRISRPYACMRFLRCCALAGVSASERSAGISIFSKWSGAAGCPGAQRSSGNSLQKSAIALIGLSGNIFHSNSVGIFRKPSNFALPGRNRIVSHFSHTEHRVGEDVDFGVGELISLPAPQACRRPLTVFENNCAYDSDFFLFTDQFLIFINNCPTRTQKLFFTYRRFASWSCPRRTAARRVVFRNVHWMATVTPRPPTGPSCSRP